MFIMISMYLTLFNLCGVVFLTAKVFAAVVDNEVYSNRDQELLKELLLRKDLVDFRFSKVLDIRLDVGENTPFDIEDNIRSKNKKTPEGTHKKVLFEFSSHKDNDSYENFLNRFEGMTNMISNMSAVLNGMVHQIEELKTNVSAALYGITSGSKKIENVEYGLRELKTNLSLLTKNQTRFEGMTNIILNMSAVLNGMEHQIEESKTNVSAALNGITSGSKKLENMEYGLRELKTNISLLTKNQTSLHDAVEKIRLLNPRSNIPSGNPKDCKEIKERGNHLSGVYEIQPNIFRSPFHVLCEMEIRGGGWTHIQKRIDGSQDFYLGWKEYKDGFGDLSREFWLGLENIHSLTAAESELLVELVDTNQTKAYAYYSGFKIGPESDGYSLSHPKFLGGEIGNSMEYHSGHKFTTKDKDQDADPLNNCAKLFHSAWWYNNCYNSDLNGKLDVPVWYMASYNFRYSAKTGMLVRRIS